MAYDLGTIGARVQLDNRQFIRGVNQMQTRTSSVLTEMQGTFLRVFGALGVIKLFKDATQVSMDFGEALSNVVSIATDLNINDVRKEITGLNSVLGTSTQLTESFYRAYSAGARGSAEELANFTAETAKLSRAIRADQVVTMEAVTKLMNSYGLEVKDATEVSDTLFQIVKLGATTGQEIAGTIGLVANTASIAGVSLNELGASLAVLTRTMPTSRAVVSLNQVITAFLDPTREAKDVAQSLGIELSATSIKTRGFANVISEINQKAGDNVEALNLMFGNVRAFRAIASLAGNQAETFKEILEDFGNKGGSALEAFAVQTDNVKTTWKTSLVDMNKALINFGDALAPMVEDISVIITEVSKVVESMDDWEFKLGLGAIAMALIIGKVRSFTIASAESARQTTMTAAAMGNTAKVAGTATMAESTYTNAINMNTQAIIANMSAGNQRAFMRQQNAVMAQGNALQNMRGAIMQKEAFAGATKQAGRFSKALSKMGGTMGILQGAMLAVPVAMASWKFGRWIAETTGFDKVMEEVWSNLVTNAREARMEGEKWDEQIKQNEVIRLGKQLKNIEENAGLSSKKIALLKDELKRAGAVGGESLRQLARKLKELLPKAIDRTGPDVVDPSELIRFSTKAPLANTLKAFTEDQAEKFRQVAKEKFGIENIGVLAGKPDKIIDIINSIPELSKALATERGRSEFKKQLGLIENDILSFQMKQQERLAKVATGEITKEQAQEETLTLLRERQKTHLMNIKNLREQQTLIMLNGTQKEKEAVLQALQGELDGYKDVSDEIKGIQQDIAENNPMAKFKQQIQKAGGIQALRESVFADDKVTQREGQAFLSTLNKGQRERMGELFRTAREKGLDKAEASEVALRTLNAELRNQMKQGNLTQNKQLSLLEQIGEKILSGEGAILITD